MSSIIVKQLIISEIESSPNNTVTHEELLKMSYDDLFELKDTLDMNYVCTKN